MCVSIYIDIYIKHYICYILYIYINRMKRSQQNTKNNSVWGEIIDDVSTLV